MPTLSFQNFTLTWGKLYITTLPYLKTDTCKDACNRIELQIACVSLFCSDVHPIFGLEKYNLLLLSKENKLATFLFFSRHRRGFTFLPIFLRIPVGK